MEMPESNHEREQELLEAPPELVAALKHSPKAPIFIPPTVDEAVLHAARRHLSRPKSSAFAWIFKLRWGFAAVAVGLLLAVMPSFLRRSTPSSGTVAIRGDLNHDGKVDILDAFALAKELKSGARVGLQLDINGDGVVDERDVTALAAKAVSLGKGGHS
jgi:hypothetical protein